MGEIVCFPLAGTETSVPALLEIAKQNQFDQVVIAAWDKNGELAVMGSFGELERVHWLLMKAANFILTRASDT